MRLTHPKPHAFIQDWKWEKLVCVQKLKENVPAPGYISQPGNLHEAFTSLKNQVEASEGLGCEEFLNYTPTTETESKET